MFESLIYKIAGKWLKGKIDLQEDSKMDSTKKWYQSQTLWSDILTIVTLGIGVADAHFGTHIASSSVYASVLAILAAVGIHGRMTATAAIQ